MEVGGNYVRSEESDGAAAGRRCRSWLRWPDATTGAVASARGSLGCMPEEIYVSTDVEADGPIPGPHSMLSFGSAAYRADKTLIATFSRNLETLPGASAHPKTAAWWATQPQAWAACRQDLCEPEQAMR
jgi:hypothetical protein